MEKNRNLEKTKKKIRTIGTVSNIILIIFSVIVSVVAFGSAAFGTIMLVLSSKMTDDELITEINSIIFEDSQNTDAINEEQKQSIKQDLTDAIDNINNNGLLRLSVDDDNNLRMTELYSILSFGMAVMCIIVIIYIRVMRSMMKTLSKGDRPFTFKAAKKLRHLSFAMLVISLVFTLTGIILFVVTLIFSYLFEYGAYLQEKADETNRIQEEIIMSFAEVTENKSEQTGKHVRRVAEYSKIIAEGMGLSEAQATNIRLASTMHDIGKLMIPSEILEKPARLTDEEFAAIKLHPGYGGRLLNNVEGDVMQLARTIALDHHERVDGRGYPAGKSENNISLEGRIVAVADVYDALTSRRSYKEPWDHQKAYEEILKGSGTQFDSDVVNAFSANYSRINEMRQKYADET